MRDTHILGGQLRSLMAHLYDQASEHHDPGTRRRLHQALALLYEAAEALGISVEHDQGSRTICSAT